MIPYQVNIYEPRYISVNDQSNLSPCTFAARWWMWSVDDTRQITRQYSRLGDECDQSMTLGKLLDNNPTLFIFIS